MSAFKQFTVQDYAIIPFNAHKQYNFDSASAALNQLSYFQTRWTSESISIYSSASSHPDGLLDPINTIKYNQIDHLFYRNFKHNNVKVFDSFNFAKHKRELYKSANVLSIPSGLYGRQIKKGSFYLSSSIYEIIDDKYGNLVISGSDTNNYPTDIHANIFKLNPLDGYKKLDLNIYKDYAIKYQTQNGIAKRHFRKGEKNPNSPSTYTTHHNIFDKDDSCYYNDLKYSKIKYQTASLNPLNFDFPFIELNSTTGSYIVSPHKPMYNFNRDDDFAISFYMKPKKTSIHNVALKDAIGGGYVFYKDTTHNYALVVYPRALYSTHSISEVNTVDATTLAICNDDVIGSGSRATTTLAALEGGTSFPLFREVNNLKKGGYSDWWVPNRMEYNEIRKILGGNGSTDSKGPQHTIGIEGKKSFYHSEFIDLDISENKYADGEYTSINGPIIGGSGRFYHDNGIKSDLPGFVTSHIGTSNKITTVKATAPYSYGLETNIQYNFNIDPSTNEGTLLSNFTDNNFYKEETIEPGLGGFTNFSNLFENKINGTFIIRKVDFNSFPYDDPNQKKYIIAKSGTKTIVPSVQTTTTGAPTATNVGNNMQFISAEAETTFPYEIYLKSSSLYFDKSDGDKVASINFEVTDDPVGIFKYTHIVCQTSASMMQIWSDGVKRAELDTSTFLTRKNTKNHANLYIGSKGHKTTNDSLDNRSTISYFNGDIGYINIYGHFLESSSIVPMSESINNSPYVGNLFYENGFAAITHPKYTPSILNVGVGNSTIGYDFTVGENDANPGIGKIKFQGTHLIHEHEFQCTVEPHEFNSTFNVTTRKDKDPEQSEFEGFTTSSYFKPYVTTVGLYNTDHELLVVGKLSQPVRMSDETDTTFILRWDI